MLLKRAMYKKEIVAWKVVRLEQKLVSEEKLIEDLHKESEVMRYYFKEDHH